MTKDQKSKAIVEMIFELSEAGVVVEFSEHMDETVVAWKKPGEDNYYSHSHVMYFNGDKGKLDSLLGIMATIKNSL